MAISTRKVPGGRFTCGLRGISILASLANAMFLFVACGAIVREAAQCIGQPHAVEVLTVTLVAGLGIVISTWGLLRESLHLVLDAVPAHISAVEIERYLSQFAGVANIHDLHI